MLLAIDIGNTNIMFGMYDHQKEDWCCTWRARTIHDKTGDEWAVLLRNFFVEEGLSFEDVEAVVMASVVPGLTGTFISMCRRYLKCDPLNIDSSVPTGVTIRLTTPSEIGPDRIVNAAAAFAMVGGPAIIVDIGTATTFDVINTQGDYLGGAIAPGIWLAHDALVSRAARLSKVELAPPPAAIGRSTVEAMQSGLYLGYVGLIEGLVARIRAELNAPEATVIATGGLAPLFKGATPVFDRFEPNITLDGLRLVWSMNQKG